jgi:SAM-dependent methyltransferase
VGAVTARLESFFGPDDLGSYRDVFTPETTAADVNGTVARLALVPGERVLDLASGPGRHAIPLGEQGPAVAGHDPSETMPARARVEVAARGVTPRWVRGDMRALPFEAAFDAAINVFTAFGFLGDPGDHVETLRRVHRALVPGGRSLLETLHRDALLARLQPNVAYTTSAACGWSATPPGTSRAT